MRRATRPLVTAGHAGFGLSRRRANFTGQISWRPSDPRLTCAPSSASFSTIQTAASRKAKPAGDTLKTRQEIEVDVEALDEKEFGVGTYVADDGESYRVLMPGTVPGQRVKFRVMRISEINRIIRGSVRGLVKESEHVVKPLCEHTNDCGGCRQQHISYDYQLAMKSDFLRNMLAGQDGKGICPPEKILPIAPMTYPYRFRNKMEFSFSSNPWVPRKPLTLVPIDDEAEEGTSEDGPSRQKAAAEEEEEMPTDFALGLYAKRFIMRRRSEQNAAKVFNVRECWLVPRAVSEILRAVRRGAAEKGLKPFGDGREREGFLRSLCLRTAEGPDGVEILIDFRTAYKDVDKLRFFVDLIRDLDLTAEGKTKCEVKSIVATVDPQAHRLLKHYCGDDLEIPEDTSLELLYGKPYIYHHMLGRIFRISASSFFQPNPTQAAVLYSVIIDACRTVRGVDKAIVWDLFCGTGSIGICVAPWVDQVFGVDITLSAIKDAEENAKLNGARNIQFFVGDLGKLNETSNNSRLIKQLPSPDVIIVDPPRPGLHDRLIKNLNGLRARRVVYVSCEVKTLRRDLEKLCGPYGSYTISHVQSVDMFPHSRHLEICCVLDAKR